MFNGQLSLTDTLSAPVQAKRARRLLFVVRVLSLAVLAGCASRTGGRAPISDITEQSSTAAAGGAYVVKPGDTLYKIARANSIGIETLKRLNNIRDPNQISVKRVLSISGGGGAPVAGGSTQTTPIVNSDKPQTRPLDQTEVVPPATSPAAATPPADIANQTTARAADANLIVWGWPATGQVTQTFNSNSKGVDIGGAVGDTITAAADGKVVYSGNGVRGLGNLVILNHQNGFITAYAHNSNLLVKTGRQVKRGTKIAELGQSDAFSPRLHFEIRRQGTPVDPLQYLPVR
jgi:lipoprotein NlpD